MELLDQHPPWELLDVRSLTKAALRQGLNLYSFDEVHFHPAMYEQLNDLLMNMLCRTDVLHES